MLNVKRHRINFLFKVYYITIWNYNNLNPKDPVALNLFTQKDLVEALEKAERRIKREKKEKEKAKQAKEISNIE